MQHAYPGAVVADRVAACQAGVKVGDAVRAADWRILVNLTATVHVAAARQVPVSQRQSWPGERGEGKKKEKKKREGLRVSRDERQFHIELTVPPADFTIYLEQIQRFNIASGNWPK